jgi:hypothetical protein
MSTAFSAELEPIQKLSQDLRAAAQLMSRAEVRYLVDSYYAMQQNRIRFANQNRALIEQAEPATLVPWLSGQAERFEKEIRKALEPWAEHQAVGRWCLSITGIGPVLTAGLLAHIDITKAPTAGKIWRFAGLDPTSKWERGQKRPWNPSLKTLCWKIGESFVKVSGREKDIYGKLWLARKALEQQRNEEGRNAEEAARRVATVGRATEAYGHYAAGRLPPGQIHARAKRYAVKIFLSHLHHVMYLDHFRRDPPKPWVIEHGGHSDMLPVPHLKEVERERAMEDESTPAVERATKSESA